MYAVLVIYRLMILRSVDLKLIVFYCICVKGNLCSCYDTSYVKKKKTMQREIDVLWTLIFKLPSALRFHLTEPFLMDVVIHLDPILSQMSPLLEGFI